MGVSILGGKHSGKSYLFQAMVYRLTDTKKAGALSYYLQEDSVRLFELLGETAEEKQLSLRSFNTTYLTWERLPATTLAGTWYRLRIGYRTGFFGRTPATMNVRFYDGSGEVFQAALTPKLEETLARMISGANVLVFCLPIWAVFPIARLTAEERAGRLHFLNQFHSMITNVAKVQEKVGKPVRSVLALTSADDVRCALSVLRERWIRPFMDDRAAGYLKELRSGWGGGVARYLANAREVSNALRHEFDTVADATISTIPSLLDLGAGPPWIVPLSAVDGAVMERQMVLPVADRRTKPPVPVHVELPLLLALCERYNVLM